MQIINVSVDKLVEYETNPRFNDEAVEQVANSIKEFGFKVPVTIDKNNVIITGHTRVKAARRLWHGGSSSNTRGGLIRRTNKSI